MFEPSPAKGTNKKVLHDVRDFLWPRPELASGSGQKKSRNERSEPELFFVAPFVRRNGSPQVIQSWALVLKNKNGR